MNHGSHLCCLGPSPPLGCKLHGRWFRRKQGRLRRAVIFSSPDKPLRSAAAEGRGRANKPPEHALQYEMAWHGVDPPRPAALSTLTVVGIVVHLVIGDGQVVAVIVRVEA